jgi:hypothetical protein
MDTPNWLATAGSVKGNLLLDASLCLGVSPYVCTSEQIAWRNFFTILLCSEYESASQIAPLASP